MSHFLDQILSLPRIDDELLPKCSKDGKWVAWTWFNTSEVSEVYAIATDGSGSPIRMTNTDQNTYFVSWYPDSKAIIVEQDHDGDERMRLFKVTLEQPELMMPLTEEDPPYFIHGGVSDPAGEAIYFSANRDAETGEESEAATIYKLDVNTEELTPLAIAPVDCASAPKISQNGKYLLYERADLHPAGRQAWLVGTDGRYDHEIINAGEAKKVFCQFGPQPDTVIVIAETETHRRVGIYNVLDAKTQWLIDDPKRDLQFGWAGENSDLICLVENIEGRARGVLLDPANGEQVSLSLDRGSLLPLGQTPSGVWIGYHYSSTQPGEIVLFDPQALDVNNWKALFDPFRANALTADDLCPAESFGWISPDGTPIHGWLTRAKGPARGTVIQVHGGPTYHSTDMVLPDIQFYARQGFNVLQPNYRGSTGYGYTFQQAILEDGWGGREMADIQSGIIALIEAGIAQEGKIAITGTSYGGYSSWWAATHFPREQIAASAPICGMTDLVVDYETTRPDLRPYSAEMIGGTPDEIPERYRERSPIHYTKDIKGKLLIVQGGQDPNVTPKNVEDVKIALDKDQIAYGVLLFEDEGHGISKRANQRTLFQRLFEFFLGSFE